MARGKKQNLSAEEMLEQALVPRDEQPFEVPDNWVWTKLEQLIDTLSGFPFDSGRFSNEPSDGFPLIRIRDIVRGYTETYTSQECSQIYHVNTGDILIGMDGDFNVASWKSEVSYLNQRVCKIKSANDRVLLDKYMLYYLPRPLKDIQDATSSVTVKHLSVKKIEAIALPLPPISEQQRIVDRIESMFTKLDQVKELAQKALDSFETRKAAILHKAFTGELTASWREEHTFESAQNRLMNIIATRSDIGSKSKELVTYMDELLIDDVSDANGWLHLKAMLLCDNITCGGTPTGFIYEHEDIPFLKVYNIVDNKIAFEEKPQFTNRETHSGKLKSSKLKPNDVIMNIVGPPLRKIAVIPDDYAEWNMNQAIVRFRTTEHVLPKFLYYCLVYPATLDEVISDTKGVVGQANISVTQSRNLNIPVPSLAEQYEIVHILDSFFDKEQKAKELIDVINKIDMIKKSILARAFRGELGTNDPSEESALKLLTEVVLTL